MGDRMKRLLGCMQCGIIIQQTINGNYAIALPTKRGLTSAQARLCELLDRAKISRSLFLQVNFETLEECLDKIDELLGIIQLPKLKELV